MRRFGSGSFIRLCLHRAVGICLKSQSNGLLEALQFGRQGEANSGFSPED